MHAQHRARGRILFEVLCAWSLAATFAGAWDQTGSSALLASAAVMSLFSVYWAFGLVGRDAPDEAAQPEIAAVANVPEPGPQPAVPIEFFAFEPEVPATPEPVAAEPKKKRARKTQKVAAVVAPDPVDVEDPVFDGPPLEQLFDTQPFVRQPRAFGRKARGPRPVAVG